MDQFRNKSSLRMDPRSARYISPASFPFGSNSESSVLGQPPSASSFGTPTQTYRHQRTRRKNPNICYYLHLFDGIAVFSFHLRCQWVSTCKIHSYLDILFSRRVARLRGLCVHVDIDLIFHLAWQHRCPPSAPSADTFRMHCRGQSGTETQVIHRYA